MADLQVQKKDLSPLRYPGSKRRLFLSIYQIIKFNRITPDVLIEPFVGGGSIFLNFLENGIAKKAIISDKDKLVYSFWKTVFNKKESLIKFIKNVRVNLDNFYLYKEIAKNEKLHDANTLAKACIFLNRTSFSGIMTNEAGPIGGSKQSSEYKINCRFNKKRIIEKINNLASFNKNVTVLNSGWASTIQFVKDLKTKNKFIFYFDPPFYNKAENLYRNFFTKQEHINFSQEILKLNNDWILSYDNCREIKRIYSENIKMHFCMPYSINSNAVRKEKELLITPLAIPLDIAK